MGYGFPSGKWGHKVWEGARTAGSEVPGPTFPGFPHILSLATQLPHPPQPPLPLLTQPKSCCRAVHFYFCTFRFLPHGWPVTAESSGTFKASWSWSRTWRLQIPSSQWLLQPPRTGHPGYQGRPRMTGGVHHGGAWSPGWMCTHGGGAAVFQVSAYLVNPFKAPTSHSVWVQARGAV